jgi:hypothetical protein
VERALLPAAFDVDFDLLILILDLGASIFEAG